MAARKPKKMAKTKTKAKKAKKATGRGAAKSARKKAAKRKAARPAAKRAGKKTSARKAAGRKTAARKSAGRKTGARKAAGRARGTSAAKPAGVRLLSGGNPQIAKADGDAPVQAYIAAMPGWKSEVGRQLDRLIERTVPGVMKAMRWNSPFYGTEANGWFLGVHCLTRYVKVAFFNGTKLDPPPPVESKNEGTRYFHIHEGEIMDETQVADWVRQAAALPGWTGFSWADRPED